MQYKTNNGVYEYKICIFDLNGTLTQEGILLKSTQEKLRLLKIQGFELYLLTGDQRNNALQFVGLEVIIAGDTQAKKDFCLQLKNLQPEKNIVCFGNARIDVGMCEVCDLRIGILGKEGLHTGLLSHVDVIFTNIDHALDFIIDPNIFGATMKI